MRAGWRSGRVGRGRGGTATALAAAVAVAALAIAIVFGYDGTVLVLPVAAATIVAAIAAHGPRGRTWWWAAAGSGIWTAEETYWAAVRHFDVPHYGQVTDAIYWVGGLLWLVALARIPNKRIPRWTLLALLPPLAIIALTLLRDPAQTLSLRFPLLEAILLLAALPALEGSLRGHASDGRLLWVSGFFVRTLTAANFSWLSATADDPTPFFLLWILAYLLIALGVWLEVRDETGGPWPAAGALVGIETAILITMGFMVSQENASDAGWLSVSALAYVQLLAVLAVVYRDRRRRVQAEEDLRGWQSLMHGLARPAQGGRRGDRPFEGLWSEACRLLPDLRGLILAGDELPTVGLAAAYSFPIVVDGAEVARLQFDRQPDESALLDALAPLVGQQILQMQDREAWRNQATTDPLTGLLNRRGLDLALPSLRVRSAQGRYPLVVAMLDLDHFKRVNDLHGHPVGDDVLRLVSRLLRHHTRDGDLVVRWGGEEFLLVLADVDVAAAIGTLGRLRRALRDSTPAPLTHPLTFSAGVAQGPGGEDDMYASIAEADAALLRAKRRGRDRVESAQAPPPDAHSEPT